MQAGKVNGDVWQPSPTQNLQAPETSFWPPLQAEGVQADRLSTSISPVAGEGLERCVCVGPAELKSRLPELPAALQQSLHSVLAECSAVGPQPPAFSAHDLSRCVSHLPKCK